MIISRASNSIMVVSGSDSDNRRIIPFLEPRNNPSLSPSGVSSRPCELTAQR